MMQKKSISQLVATVLLIVITIALAAIIFFWVFGFVKEKIEKFGRPIEEVCQEVVFEATLQASSDEEYYIYVTNNGNVNINDFTLKIYSMGETTSNTIGGGGVLAGESKKMLTLQVRDWPGIDDPEAEITIIPVLLGNLKGTTKEKSFECGEEFGKRLR